MLIVVDNPRQTSLQIADVLCDDEQLGGRESLSSDSARALRVICACQRGHALSFDVLDHRGRVARVNSANVPTQCDAFTCREPSRG